MAEIVGAAPHQARPGPAVQGLLKRQPHTGDGRDQADGDCLHSTEIDGAHDIEQWRVAEIRRETLILKPDRQHCGDNDAGNAGQRHEAGGEAKAEGGDRHTHEQDRTQQGDRRPNVVGQHEGLGGAVGEGQKKVAPRVIEDLDHSAASDRTDAGEGTVEVAATRRAAPPYALARLSASSKRASPSQCCMTLLKRKPAWRSVVVMSLSSGAGKVSHESLDLLTANPASGHN
jgi:hypothetical protein